GAFADAAAGRCGSASPSVASGTELQPAIRASVRAALPTCFRLVRASAAGVPKLPRIHGLQRLRAALDLPMWILLLEALAALVILAVIVWWTMFAGRRHGEPAPPGKPPRRPD
ncbi:MAG: hypothetical protein M3Z16_07610, partial [Pseudomonadota bacterium]|nr:hypothetical protein [Pseudomonadota bacterium]